MSHTALVHLFVAVCCSIAALAATESVTATGTAVATATGTAMVTATLPTGSLPPMTFTFTGSMPPGGEFPPGGEHPPGGEVGGCPRPPRKLAYNINVTGNSCGKRCGESFCQCMGGSGAHQRDRAVISDCVMPATPPTSNCTRTAACWRRFMACVHSSAQEGEDACPDLRDIGGAIKALGGRKEAFDGSDLRKACRFTMCLSLKMDNCPATDADVNRLCAVPFVRSGRLTLSGNWAAILGDQAKKQHLIDAIRSDLAKAFGVATVSVTVSAGAARRAEGDLVVAFQVLVAELAASTTFADTIKELETADASSVLSAAVAVYTTNGGNAADVAVTSVVDTSPDGDTKDPADTKDPLGDAAPAPRAALLLAASALAVGLAAAL